MTWPERVYVSGAYAALATATSESLPVAALSLSARALANRPWFRAGIDAAIKTYTLMQLTDQLRNER